MKLHWQYKMDRKKLLIFCSGWGMDEHPFMPLTSDDYDVALLYDYRESIECSGLLDEVTSYSERVLMGWSMGVWGGQQLFSEHAALFDRAIAINGTLCPVNDRYGIPRELFAGTMAGWSELSRRKFYHRLAGNKDVERTFLCFQPKRTVVDQQQELAYYLNNADCIDPKKSMYREVIVSERDRIVPTANQLEYWGERVLQLAGGHFPFYRWSSWDEALRDIRCLL